MRRFSWWVAVLITVVSAHSNIMAQVTIWSDDFNDNTISDWGYDAGTCSVSGGQVHLSYTGMTYYYLVSPTIDNSLGESFYYDAVLALDVLDRAKLEFSANGTTFTEIGNMTQGIHVSVPIAAEYRTAQFKFRLKYRLYDSDSAITLDNVMITRQGLMISPDTASLTVAETLQFTVTGGIAPYDWEVANENVGTISTAGLFTAEAEGTTTVSVSDSTGDSANSGDIDVSYMILTPNNGSLFVGDSLQFSVRGGVGPYAWDTSDHGIGTISNSGLFSAVSVGTCTVSVTDSTFETIESDLITVHESGGGDPVTTLVEHTSYPHGPTRLWNSRNIVQSPNGILYCAYGIAGETPARDVKICMSANGGANWTEIGRTSTLVQNHRRSYSPSIDIDDNNVVHLAWYGDQTTAAQNYKIWYSSYNGAWSNATVLSTGTSTTYQAAFPSLCSDAEGNVLVSWACLDGTSGFDGPFFAKKWEGTWTAQLQLDDGCQNSASVAMYDINGLGLVGWATPFTDPTAANALKLAYINPNGTVNSTATPCQGLNYDMPSMAFNPQGDLFLFYNLTSPDGGEVTHFRWKAASDQTWRLPLTFNGETLQSVFGNSSSTYPLLTLAPQVTIDESGNIYVLAEGAMSNESDADWNIYWNKCAANSSPDLSSRYTIEEWTVLSDAQKLYWEADDDAAFASVPRQIYNTSGVLPVVWSDGPIISDNNTAHYPEGEHNSGTWADIYFKSIALTMGPTPTPGASTPTPTIPPVPTFTPTFTPTTAPGEPTNTPVPTSTSNPPTSTPTAPPGEPTYTPNPTNTPAGTPSDTEITVELNLTESVFHTDDLFLLTTHEYRVGDRLAVDEYLALEVYGQFWFYPSWTNNLEYTRKFVETGEYTQTIFSFTWPAVDGSAYGLHFYYLMTEPGNYNLLSNVGIIEFGYE